MGWNWRAVALRRSPAVQPSVVRMPSDMKVALGVFVLLILAVGVWAWASRSPKAPSSEAEPSVLDYDKLVHLDSEDLAEQGIGKAYARLGPHLRSHGVEPAPLEEVIDESGPSYRLRFRGIEYVIYSPNVPGSEENSWGLATFAFFAVINQQLSASETRFYAIDGGNDLGGMFLTAEEVARAKASLRKREDWPYLPTEEAPWFGQEH